MSKAEKSSPPNDEKLRELILYIAETSEGDAAFGSTKLNLILFYSDFQAYLHLGRPITGQEYQALQTGPAPRCMTAILEMMQEDRILAIRESDFRGLTQRRPLALRSADLTTFTGGEIALIDRVIRQFWNLTGAEVGKLSHEFVGWHIVERGQTIPYEIALIHTRELSDGELQWADELEPRAKELLADHATV